MNIKKRVGRIADQRHVPRRLRGALLRELRARAAIDARREKKRAREARRRQRKGRRR